MDGLKTIQIDTWLQVRVGLILGLAGWTKIDFCTFYDCLLCISKKKVNVETDAAAGESRSSFKSVMDSIKFGFHTLCNYKSMKCY